MDFLTTRPPWHDCPCRRDGAYC